MYPRTYKRVQSCLLTDSHCAPALFDLAARPMPNPNLLLPHDPLQACERKTCPNQCNGHGRCQSMSYYASLKNPGVGPVYKYKQVWDADLLYGCNCDSGYFGPDCSLKHCPTGDDPFTGTSIDPKTQQYNEKQQVVCVATDGSFTLSFRGETTAPIPADASAAKVKAALQVRALLFETSIK